MSDVFSDFVISAYSRAQAIADGVLVDVTATAKETALRGLPVALTKAVFVDCVQWSDASGDAAQDQAGRLWDVLHMAAVAAHLNKGVSEFVFDMCRIPQGSKTLQKVKLKVALSGGDNGETVATIMFPEED